MSEMREELQALADSSRALGRDGALLDALKACKAARDNYEEMRKSPLLTQAGKDLYTSSWVGADQCMRAVAALLEKKS
jgi:hypothetical protein